MSLIEDQLLAAFGRRLEGEVKDAVEEGNYLTHIQHHVALTQVFLEYLREANLIPETELAPHEDTVGRNRCRLMAWSLPDDSSRLELYTASFIPPVEGETLPQSEVEQLGHRAARFVSYAFKRDAERFADSPEAQEAAQAVCDARGRIDEVRVNILTNASVKDRRATKATTVEGLPVSFSVWDAERLHRIAGEEFGRDLIDIDFTELTGRPMPCLEMKPPAKDYQSLFDQLIWTLGR